MIFPQIWSTIHELFFFTADLGMFTMLSFIANSPEVPAFDVLECLLSARREYNRIFGYHILLSNTHVNAVM
jgi:hypothetical protein